MENEQLSYVEDLNSKKDFWNIKVRIIRKWRVGDYRIDMVLIDEKGQKIQGFVKDKLIGDFDDLIHEDAVVVLKKCGVAEQKDHYPVIVLNKKINFYKCTKVEPAVAFRGHPYGFGFKNFPEIDEKMLKEAHSVDVIGNVASCGNLDVFKKRNGEETKKINFQLQDLQGNVVECTLWDGYAQNFSDYLSTHTSNEHLIAVIQHGKLKMWRGVVTVQNDKYGTRLFLNDEIEDINTFRRRLILNEAGVATSQSQLSSQTNYPVRTEFVEKSVRKHVDELRETTEEGTFVVVGKITMLEEEFGWFYPGCRKCAKKVLTKAEYLIDDHEPSKELEESASDSLWCPRCHSLATSVVPKFKVQFRVQDDTGSVSFLMFDKDVFRVGGVAAADIRERQLKSGDLDKFPNELDALVTKLIAFKVVVTSNHIKKNYHVYTVSKVCDDPDVIAELVAQDAVHEVAEDQETVDGSTVNLDESSQLGLDSKDAVSITGSSLAQDIEKDSETSPLGKRPIQAVDNQKKIDGDCSATKRTRKRLVKPNV